MTYAIVKTPVPQQDGIFGSWRQVHATRPVSPLMGALGQTVSAQVPYTTSKGAQGVAKVNATANCGNTFGLQQMLKDLGYGIAVDGIRGPQTNYAVTFYAGSRGIPHAHGSAPSPAVCTLLINEWMQLKGKTPSGSGCGPGKIGWPPYCVDWPPKTPPQPTSPPPPGVTTCPPGTMGIPPACLSLPGKPVPIPVPPTPQPQTPPQPPPPQPPPPQPAPPHKAGMSDTEMGLLIGAGVIGVIALGVLLFRRDEERAPAPAFTPNLARGGRYEDGVPIVRGKRWGRASIPKRYRKLGATSRKDFAYPDRYMYLIVDRDHTIAAKGRFTQHKADYPMAVRRIIARNLNKASRKFGLPQNVKP